MCPSLPEINDIRVKRMSMCQLKRKDLLQLVFIAIVTPPTNIDVQEIFLPGTSEPYFETECDLRPNFFMCFCIVLEAFSNNLPEN